MQCSGFRIQPRQEFGVDAEIVELVGGAPGIGNYTAGRISAKTCLKIQQGCKEREFRAGDLVHRKVVGNTRDVNAGKLAPT